MKSLFFALVLMFVSVIAFGAEGQLSIFGGQGATLSGGGSQATAQGGSAAAIFGLSSNTTAVNSNNAGAANTTISPSGVTSQHVNNSNVIGSSTSGALGIAGAGGGYGGNAAGLSGATGTFGTVGLGVVVTP